MARNAPIAEYPTREKPVKLYQPTGKSRYFRACYYRPGDKRQQTRSLGRDEVEARRDAKALADQLVAIQRTPKLARAVVTVDVLVKDYLREDNHPKWKGFRTPEKARNIALRFADEHFRSLVCVDVETTDFQEVLDRAERLPKDGEMKTVPLSRAYLTDLKAFLTGLRNFGIMHYYFDRDQFRGELVLPRCLEDEVHEGLSFMDLEAELHASRDENDEDNPTFQVDRTMLPTWDRIQEVTGHIDSPIYVLMVLFAAATGMRFGELVALRWNDIDPHNREIRVVRKLAESTSGHLRIEKPKNGKERLAVYPVWLSDAVTARVAKAREQHRIAVDAAKRTGDELDPHAVGLLFPAPRGGFTRRSNFHKRVWRPAVAAARWRPDWTFHTLRHVAAVHLIYGEGCSTNDVSATLGHSDVGVTERIYVQPTEDSTRKIAANTASATPPWERSTQPPASVVPLPLPFDLDQTA